MDDADRASQLEEAERKAVLSAARQANNRPLVSLEYCIDCGLDIEPARREAGNAIRCCECEGYYSQELRQKGFARCR